MNKAEMSEIFAVLMLAYPNAEMFRAPSPQALKGKLAPTITLWATCLSDVDYWTAQQAVIKLCRSCKFPPTIAELKEQADAVVTEVQAEIRQQWNVLCLWRLGGDKGIHEVCDSFREDSRLRKAIDAMGGPDALVIQRELPDGGSETWLNYDGFRSTYEALLRKNGSGLPVEGQKRLNG